MKTCPDCEGEMMFECNVLAAKLAVLEGTPQAQPATLAARRGNTMRLLTQDERDALSPADSVAYEQALEAEAEAAAERQELELLRRMADAVGALLDAMDDYREGEYDSRVKGEAEAVEKLHDEWREMTGEAGDED